LRTEEALQNNCPTQRIGIPLFTRCRKKPAHAGSIGLADYLLVQPKAKRFALAQNTLHDDPSETLTAVETAKGVLLFEYSGYGKMCCHSYMQHLADHFFITDEDKPEFVNLYKLANPNVEAIKAFQTSTNPFSLYTNDFIPDKAQYLDAAYPEKCTTGQDPSHRTDV
jgi:hypothetical protein